MARTVNDCVPCLLSTVLDLVPLAVVVTDGFGEVRLANRQAKALAVDEVLLGRLLDGLLTGDDETPQLPPRQKGGPDGASRLLCLGDGRLLPVIDREIGEGLVAHVLGDPERRVLVSRGVLRQLFNFSLAESRVAQQLTIGHSVGEIARTLGVTTNTIRFHLKQIYAKTRTGGQSALVSMLLNSPALFAPEATEESG